jgi:CO/xanthine dehydrogenase FAD-binding subunit
LKEVLVPPPDGRTGVYLKLRLRKSIDYPLLGVAVNLLPGNSKGSLKEISLALTGVEKSPLRVEIPAGTEELADLEKQAAILAAAAYKVARPVANTSGYSARYRREMVRVYVRQGIFQALEIASGRRSAL